MTVELRPDSVATHDGGVSAAARSLSDRIDPQIAVASILSPAYAGFPLPVEIRYTGCVDVSDVVVRRLNSDESHTRDVASTRFAPRRVSSTAWELWR